MSGIADADQMAVLLRISAGIDVVGDLTVTVANPADLVAWTYVLPEAVIGAWRASESGHRFAQISARSEHTPVHGQVTAVLDCNKHPLFWASLVPDGDLEPGDDLVLTPGQLTDAWVRSTTADAT